MQSLVVAGNHAAEKSLLAAKKLEELILQYEKDDDFLEMCDKAKNIVQLYDSEYYGEVFLKKITFNRTDDQSDVQKCIIIARSINTAVHYFREKHEAKAPVKVRKTPWWKRKEVILAIIGALAGIIVAIINLAGSNKEHKR